MKKFAAVIGYGGMGGWHTQHLLKSDVFELAGIYDIKEERRALAESRGIHAYATREELLADPNVEAVYIPLPNHLHLEWTCKALQAKKHVLCEKPLAPTVAEIEKMIATAKENNVFLMEAFAYLHSPLIHAIKADLDSGIIGDPIYMESAFITSSGKLG
mgnify:CR=1 FL=1